MNVNEFVEELSNLSFNENEISYFFDKLIIGGSNDLLNSYEKDDSEVFRRKVKESIYRISDDKFTAFQSLLDYLIHRCEQHIGKSETQSSSTSQHIEKLKRTRGILQKVMSIYKEVSQEKYPPAPSSDPVASASDQQNEVLKEIKIRIDDLNKDIDEANKAIDSKIFSLLINTVAIVGIFVAIAYTGFGVVSIFSSIDIEISLTSKAAFLKSLFFLLIVAFLSYNLLLLLIYFIFKLSRPIHTFIQNSKEKFVSADYKNLGFNNTVNLKPFWIVDWVMLIVVISFFIVSLYN